MRRPILLTLALCFLPMAAAAQRSVTEPPAAGTRPAPSPAPGKAGTSEARRAYTLDDLFARLAAAGDAEEAKGIATLIERRFARSGSDTADLLMSRAGIALGAKDAALAVELLDRVTRLRPDWAEAWRRRAAAFSLLDDPVDALADIGRAVRSEPRHFGAWEALGDLAMGNDDKRRALDAYRKALSIHPFLEDARKMVDRLAPEVDGRDL